MNFAKPISNTLYQAIFEQNVQPMLVFQSDCCRLGDVNKAAAELYGYSKAEFLSLNPGILSQRLNNAATADRQTEKVGITSVFSPGIADHYSRSGQMLHLQIKTAEIETEGEKAVLVILYQIMADPVTQDITEKKNSEQKFKAVFDNTTDEVLIGDDQGQCLDYNQAAVTLFGYSRAELNNMGLHQLLKYPGEKSYSVLWKRFLSGRIRSGIMELQKKDSSVIKAGFNAKPGIMPGMHLCVITDVTRQLKQQERLAGSERRFKALVQEGADLISIVDIDGNYRFLSENSLKVLGNNPRRLVGKCAFDLIHPEDRSEVVALFSKLEVLKRIQTEPFRIKDSDGTWRWIRTIATNLLHDPAVGGIVCNSRDITEAVLKTNQLKHSNERYRLIMNASHEAIFDWAILEDRIEWGSSFSDNFGYNLTNTNSYQLYNSIERQDQNRVWAEIEDAMSSPAEKIIFSECRFHKACGELVRIQYRLIFLRYQQGRVYRVVGSLRDMTSNRKRVLTVKAKMINLVR